MSPSNFYYNANVSLELSCYKEKRSHNIWAEKLRFQNVCFAVWIRKENKLFKILSLNQLKQTLYKRCPTLTKIIQIELNVFNTIYPERTSEDISDIKVKLRWHSKENKYWKIGQSNAVQILWKFSQVWFFNYVQFLKRNKNPEYQFSSYFNFLVLYYSSQLLNFYFIELPM